MKRIEQRRKWFLVFYIFRFGVLLLCSSLTACTVKTANSDLKIPKVQLERLHGCNAQDTSTYSKCSVRCTHAQWLAFSLSICPLPFRKPKLMEIVYSKWPEDKKKMVQSLHRRCLSLYRCPQPGSKLVLQVLPCTTATTGTTRTTGTLPNDSCFQLRRQKG